MVIRIIFLILLFPFVGDATVCDGYYRFKTVWRSAPELRQVNRSAWIILGKFERRQRELNYDSDSPVQVIRIKGKLSSAILGELYRITGDRFIEIEDQQNNRYLVRTNDQYEGLSFENLLVIQSAQLRAWGVIKLQVIRLTATEVDTDRGPAFSFLPEFSFDRPMIEVIDPYGHSALFLNRAPEPDYPNGYLLGRPLIRAEDDGTVRTARVPLNPRGVPDVDRDRGPYITYFHSPQIRNAELAIKALSTEAFGPIDPTVPGNSGVGE